MTAQVRWVCLSCGATTVATGAYGAPAIEGCRCPTGRYATVIDHKPSAPTQP